MRARLRRLAAAIGLLLPIGCATGSQHSGFLGDYDALQPGAEGGPRLVYIDAGIDFSGYERVIVEPVIVWKSDEARFAGVSPAQRDVLARKFEAELERALGEEFQLVEAPGPGTLRVRNALAAAIAGSGTSDLRQLQYIEVEQSSSSMPSRTSDSRQRSIPRDRVRLDRKNARRSWRREPLSRIGPSGSRSGWRHCEPSTANRVSPTLAR